jgi:hypothetical protein
MTTAESRHPNHADVRHLLMTRTRLALLVILLLAIPSALSAACTGWVLWEQRSNYQASPNMLDTVDTWQAESGHDQFADCEAAARGASSATLAGMRERNIPVDTFPPSRLLNIRLPGQALRGLNWQCFPDTIDPRVPAPK